MGTDWSKYDRNAPAPVEAATEKTDWSRYASPTTAPEPSQPTFRRGDIVTRRDVVETASKANRADAGTMAPDEMVLEQRAKRDEELETNRTASGRKDAVTSGLLWFGRNVIDPIESTATEYGGKALEAVADFFGPDSVQLPAFAKAPTSFGDDNPFAALLPQRVEDNKVAGPVQHPTDTIESAPGYMLRMLNAVPSAITGGMEALGTGEGGSIAKRVREGSGFAGGAQDAAVAYADAAGIEDPAIRGMLETRAWGVGFVADIIFPAIPGSSVLAGIRTSKAVDAAREAGAAISGAEKASEVVRAGLAAELSPIAPLFGASGVDDIAKRAAEQVAEKRLADAVEVLKGSEDAKGLDTLGEVDQLRNLDEDLLRQTATRSDLSDEAFAAIKEAHGGGALTNQEALEAVADTWLRKSTFDHLTAGKRIDWASVTDTPIPAAFRDELIGEMADLNAVRSRMVTTAEDGTKTAADSVDLTLNEQQRLMRHLEGTKFEASVRAGSMTRKELDEAAVLIYSKTADRFTGQVPHAGKVKSTTARDTILKKAERSEALPAFVREKLPDSVRKGLGIVDGFDVPKIMEGLPSGLSTAVQRLSDEFSNIPREMRRLLEVAAREHGYLKEGSGILRRSFDLTKVQVADIIPYVFKGGQREFGAAALYERLGGADIDGIDAFSKAVWDLADQGVVDIDGLNAVKRLEGSSEPVLKALGVTAEDVEAAMLRYAPNQAGDKTSNAAKRLIEELGSKTADEFTGGLGVPLNEEKAIHGLLIKQMQTNAYNRVLKEFSQRAVSELMPTTDEIVSRARAAMVSGVEKNGAPRPAPQIMRARAVVGTEPVRPPALPPGVDAKRWETWVRGRVSSMLGDERTFTVLYGQEMRRAAAEFTGAAIDEASIRKVLKERFWSHHSSREKFIDAIDARGGNGEKVAAATEQQAYLLAAKSMEASGVGRDWAFNLHPEVRADAGVIAERFTELARAVYEGKPVSQYAGLEGWDTHANRIIGSFPESGAKKLKDKMPELATKAPWERAHQAARLNLSESAATRLIEDGLSGRNMDATRALMVHLDTKLRQVTKAYTGRELGLAADKGTLDRFLGAVGGGALAYIGSGGSMVGTSYGMVLGGLMGARGAINFGKANMLGGSLLLAPSYHAINAIGQPFIAALTQGARGVGLLAQGMLDPVTISRVWKATHGWDPSANARTVAFLADDGKAWTYGDLAAALGSRGLQGTDLQVELASSLAKDFQAFTLATQNPKLIDRMAAWRGRYFSPGEGRNPFMEAAVAVDEFSRIAAATAALKQGRGLEEAIATSRDLFFDYSRMLPVERNKISRAIWFWSFRRNAWDYVATGVLTRPNDVARLLRAETANFASVIDEEEGFQGRIYPGKEHMMFRSMVDLQEDLERDDGVKHRFAKYAPLNPVGGVFEELTELVVGFTGGAEGGLDPIQGGMQAFAALAASPQVEMATMLAFDKAVSDAGLRGPPTYTDPTIDFWMKETGHWDEYTAMFGIVRRPPDEGSGNRAHVDGQQWYIPLAEDRRRYHTWRMATRLLGQMRALSDYAPLVSAVQGDTAGVSNPVLEQGAFKALGGTVSAEDPRNMVEVKQNVRARQAIEGTVIGGG